MTRHWISAIAALLSVSAGNADELVGRADANGDGLVSIYELRAAYYADAEFNRRIEQSFADYDADGDGMISEAERRAKQVETAVAPGTANKVLPATAATAATAASTPADNSKASAGRAGSIGGSVDAPLPSEVTPSRSESLIMGVDADNSGGASMEELVNSGDGSQWFTDSAFNSADKNGDDDLDPDELEVLLRSLERRRH